MTEDPEHPPNPSRRRRATVGVVGDHPVGIADTEGADFRGEGIGIGQHMGQVGVPLGDVVDVEADRSWHMRDLEFGPRIARRLLEKPSRIDDDQFRCAEVGLEPAGIHQGLGIHIVHFSSPFVSLIPPLDATPSS